MHRSTRPLGLLLAIALALGVVGCGNDDDSAGGRTPVVIDSDGAFDDLAAIAYLLEHPDVEVLALTMSGTGIAHCPAAAENAAAVLELLDAPDIPVACGRTSPLEGFNTAPTAWRKAADDLGGLPLPEPRPLADVTAPELLAATIDKASADVVLVALGPLTNIAEAVEAEPTVLDEVAMMYLMGGAVDAAGNTGYAGNDDAEFNIWADPHAAAIVFDTDVALTLVPLDATNAVPVTPRFYDAVATHREASPTATFLADYLDANPLLGGAYFWDQLAAVAAFDPSVVTVEERVLAVVEEGGLDAGATIESPDGRPVLVAVDADAAAFERAFFAKTIGTAEPDVPAWEPDGVVTADGVDCSYEGADPLPESAGIRVDNSGAEAVVVIAGAYDPGTTTADLDAWLERPATGEPAWWTSTLQMFVPPGAHDVWIVDVDPDGSLICFTDVGELSELAGRKLRSPDA